MARKNVQEIKAILISQNNGPYVPTMVNINDLHIHDRGFAWRLASCTKDDPIWGQIRQSVAEYNAFVEELRSMQGFFNQFAENGYFISIEDISSCYGDTLANRVKSLKHYKFSTELVYQNGFLFDAGYSPKYRVHLPEHGDISFVVGPTDAGYPEDISVGKKLLWNWSDDERDFTFALWALFDELGYLPEENEKKNYDGYLCYDQHRYTMERPDPNLMRCFNLLISMGYLTQYSVVPEQASPWFRYRSSENGTIGLAVLDMGFIKDPLLIEKIRLILNCAEDDIVQKRYFLTNGEGKQELSDKPGLLGGHQRYKIYGRMDCSSANRHIANGRYIRGRVFFADEETAIAAGYRPCAICMRSEYNKWKNNHNG